MKDTSMLFFVKSKPNLPIDFKNIIMQIIRQQCRGKTNVFAGKAPENYTDTSLLVRSPFAVFCFPFTCEFEKLLWAVREHSGRPPAKNNFKNS
jgi:hypothetical protein